MQTIKPFIVALLIGCGGIFFFDFLIGKIVTGIGFGMLGWFVASYFICKP